MLTRHDREDGYITFVGLLMLAAYIALFIWYDHTAIPHTYPRPYTTFWWGMVHGAFIVPTFIVSLFQQHITIYQVANDGGWYNFGYLLGIGGTLRVVISI